MTRLLPGLFEHYRVRPGRPLPGAAADRAARRSRRPAGRRRPTVVVWTPGPFNSAYFEHAFLARQMGVELVEASDLVVRDAVCHIRTTRGLQRVHAIYRRIDDDFMDPLEFRPDSVLGVPGLMRAYRAGSVAIVNAVGTGVADDKAIYHYVPEMIRYYLGEEPIIAERPDLPDVRPRAARVGARAARPGRGQADQRVRRQGRLHRPDRDRGGDRRARRRRSSALPERWIAQDLVQLSTVPTAGPDGTLAPRHVDLRPFAVFGEDIHIVPGGLTRVALREGSMIVNSSQGGGSKDTWVLEEDAEAAPRAAGAAAALVAAADARPPARRRLVLPAAATAAVDRCSPGSPTSCTGSAASWRAPSTPRGCSTASSTPTCRAARTTRPACG